MEFNYSLGLSSVILTGILLALVASTFFIKLSNIISFFFSKGQKKYQKYIEIIIILYVLFTLLLVFILLVYPTVNYLTQYKIAFNWKFIETEIRNGIFALRISSFLLAYKLLQVLIETGKNRYTNRDLMAYRIVQYGFYTFPLAVLWIFAATGMQSLSIILLNWAVFIIIDDWSIIEDYSRKINIPPIKAHLIRVVLLDILISIFSIWSIGSHFNPLVAMSILPIFLFITIFTVYGAYRVSLLTKSTTA